MEFEIKTIQQYLRSNIKEWYDYSIKICGGKCVITGDIFEVIHHKYPFHKIVEETFKELDADLREDINNYGDKELESIKEKCLELHFKYGAGACMTTESHKELHNIFGNDISIKDFEEYKYCKDNNLEIKRDGTVGRKTKYKDLNLDKPNVDLYTIDNIKNKLLSNLQILNNIDSMQFKYPNLFKIIKSKAEILIEMHNIAIQQLMTFQLIYTDTNLFFISIRDMLEKVNLKDTKRMNKRINILTCLLLINKPDLNDKQVTMIKHIYSTNSNKKTKICPTVYQMPIYDEELLYKSEIMAKKFKENKITERDFTITNLNVEEIKIV